MTDLPPTPNEQPVTGYERPPNRDWNDDDLDDEGPLCECGGSGEYCECSQCGWQGCTECIHDGGDDLYPYLCDDCDP